MSRFLSGDESFISKEGDIGDRFLGKFNELGRAQRDLVFLNKAKPEGAQRSEDVLRQRAKDAFAANNFGLEGVENAILLDAQAREVDEARFENMVLGNEPLIENAVPVDRDQLALALEKQKKINLAVNVARGAIVGGTSLFVAYKIKKALDAKRKNDKKIAKELLEKEKMLKEKLKKKSV